MRARRRLFTRGTPRSGPDADPVGHTFLVRPRSAPVLLPSSVSVVVPSSRPPHPPPHPPPTTTTRWGRGWDDLGWSVVTALLGPVADRNPDVALSLLARADEAVAAGRARWRRHGPWPPRP
ncbi:hypothetical protein TEK04_11190 [Klenkia sp. LSe6-5]|uniref:Uncharacterized protein n=1 Tax=Klenkia sesuvii TaxID=3103137 RepID=A0ABU8DTW6_9ACTN